MIAERKAPERLRNPWWRSASGTAVEGWFKAWGMVHRERFETGDPTALPYAASLVNGGGRGSPSDPSECLLKFESVESFLRSFATPRQERLMGFVFASGMDWFEGQVRLNYGDGTASDWLAARPVPLGPQVTLVESSWHSAYTYDLELFDAPELLEVARMWRHQYSELLERELLRLARWFAKERGL